MVVVLPRQSCAFSTGLKLGAGTALAGAILDQEAAPIYDPKLYTDSWTLILFNLLCLGPMFYRATACFTVRKRLFSVLRDTIGLVVVHSGLYSLAHCAMHRVAALRPIHQHHHKFRDRVMPSSANAVSPLEFAWAYMMPFFVGTALISPAPAALVSSVIIVSSCNLLVHSEFLRDIAWPEFLVSPRTHLTHHLRKTPSYAAPTIDWGVLHKKVRNLWRDQEEAP